MSGGKWGWVVSDELAIMANQHGNFGSNLTKKHCYLLLLTAVVGSHVLLSLLITPYYPP